MSVQAPARRGSGGYAAVGASQALSRSLTSFTRAYQLQAALTWAVRLAAAGLAADGLVLVAARLTRRDLPDPLLLLAAPLLGALVGIALGLLRRPSQLWLARQIDSRLGLRERTLTALELSRRPDQPLASDQLADAIAHLRRAEPLEAFPLRVPRREVLVALILAVWLIPLQLIGTPPPTAATATQELLALGEAERIMAVADEIEREEASPEEAASNAQLANLLREVGEALREARADADRAVARLSDAERRLSALQSLRAFDVAAALARVADALDREQRTRQVAGAIDRRDYQRAASETRALGPRAANGTELDRQAIAEAMRRGATAAARYDERLADALRQAAERAGRGEADAADAAAREMSRAGGEMRRQESLERALSQLQNSRQSIASGGEQPSGGSGRAERGSAIGQGEANRAEGPGQGRGQGASGQSGAQGEGDDPGVGGSTAGTGSGSARTDLYDPAATRARQVEVPGGDFDRPQIGEGELQEGSEGEVRVDYRDVLPTYQDRATRAMQDRYVPLSMKDLVREYFSSLGGP